MRRFIAAAIVASAVVASPAQAEVVIAVAGPMTGTNAWYGEQIQRGAELAVADLNAAGGILKQQLRLVTTDDFCDGEQAVAVARNLVSTGAVLVVGHFCSAASIPASKVYEAAGVPMISPASTNPLLTEQGSANVFRVTGRDDTQGTVAGNYLADHWADKKIAILHDGTVYGIGLAEETRKQLNKRGITEVVYQGFMPGKSDYSGEIAALQAAQARVLYVGGYHTEIALIARAAYDRHYALQVLSGDTLQTEEFSLIAGPAAEGTLFTWLPDPRRHAEAAQVVKRFRAEGFEPEGYTLLSYAAVQVWTQAVEKAASLDSRTVIASLHSGRFNTVIGPIDFDEKGDLTNYSPIWYVWKAGKYVPLN